MSKKIMLRLAVIMLGCLGGMGSVMAATHFTATTYTAADKPLGPMTVKIPIDIKPTIAGNAIAIDDEIAIFSPGGDCAGVGIWTGADLTINVTGVDIANTTTASNALREGKTLSYRVWSNKEKKEAPATVTYADEVTTFSSGKAATLKTLVANSQLTFSTFPALNKVLKVGDIFEIKWNNTGTAKAVNIDLIVDDKVLIPIKEKATTGTTGTFSWTIPNNILIDLSSSSTCKLHIYDADDKALDIGATTKDAFTITTTLTIPTIKPMVAGTQQSISFTANGNVGDVAIQYSTNNGKDWAVISNQYKASSGQNTFPFTPKPAEISNQCLIKIFKIVIGTVPAYNPSITSNAFTIFSSISNVSASKTTGTLYVGNKTTISWSANTNGRYRIEYAVAKLSNGNPDWKLITISSLPSYEWTIPKEAISKTCQIQISDSAFYDGAKPSATFVVEAKPTISIGIPNDTASWAVGTQHDITWSTSGTVQNVKVEFRRNQTAQWSTITGSTTNTGNKYSWIVPDSISDFCKIKLSVVGFESTAFDTSSKFFKIIPASIKITFPAKNGSIKTGTPYNITWKPIGIADANNKVKIEFTADNKTWITIAAGESNLPKAGANGICTYAYTFSDTFTSVNNCKLRISQVNASAMPRDSVVFDLGAKTTPTLSVTSPNGSATEKYLTGSTLPISWTSTGIIDSVKLEYKNDASNWHMISKAGNSDKGGSYTWQISDTITPSKTCKIRVSAINIVETATDTSNQSFELALPSISITSPEAKDSWNALTAHDIIWTADSLVAKVKIEYSVNNGKDWSLVKDSLASAKGGKYSWMVVDKVSDSCKIKITMVGRTAVTTTGALFSIIAAPKLAIATPNGKEKFNQGDKTNISWGSFDVAGDIKIEFTKDNGKNWSLIKDSVKVTELSFAWVVPAEKADSCKIRITSKANASITDMSDSVFSILDKPVSVMTLPAKACLLGAGIKASKMGFNLTIGSPKSIVVSARIMNLQGREIMSLSSRSFSAGYHTLSISSPSLKNGFYIAEVNLGGMITRKSVSFVK